MAQIAVWMVAINPLTKLPLGLRPVRYFDETADGCGY